MNGVCWWSGNCHLVEDSVTQPRCVNELLAHHRSILSPTLHLHNTDRLGGHELRRKNEHCSCALHPRKSKWKDKKHSRQRLLKPLSCSYLKANIIHQSQVFDLLTSRKCHYISVKYIDLSLKY